jgi:peptidoglycan/LPS O-acetylase OafA/YrhL
MLPRRTDQGKGGGFRPDIEGLRGIAVLLVVFYHSGVPAFSGGFIGVDVFFALSGYLITGLILNEVARTGKLSFRNFYARRARRLLPAAGFVIVCTLVIGLVMYSPLELARYAKWAAYTSVYASNYMFMRDASNYFASDVAGNPYLHTWSLAVEEQFYLFWPTLIMVTLLIVKSRRRLAILLLAMSAVSLGLCIWTTEHRPPWAFFSLPTRAWEFGLGGLAVMLPAQGLATLRRKWIVALGWAGLAAIVVAGCYYTSQTRFPGVTALLPVLGTIAALISGASGVISALSRLLGSAVLQYLGRLSYSWYLWHWPILLAATLRFPEITWYGKLLAATVALLFAQVSFTVIERPIRFNKFLMPRPVLSLGLAPLVAIIGVSTGLMADAHARRSLASSQQATYWAAANDPRILFDAHCLTPAASAHLAQCEYGDRTSDQTVVLFGDSHAEHWFPALERLATEKHWRLVTVLKSSCPVAKVDVYSVVLKRQDIECSSWRAAALKLITQLHPRIVILSEADEVVADHTRSAKTEGRRLVPPQEWEEGLRSTVSYLDSGNVKTLVISDVPRPGFDVPTCLSRAAAHTWAAQDCAIDRVAALNEDARQAESAAVSGFKSARLVDFADTLCTGLLCQTVVDGQVVFRDSNHLTSNFARGLAPALEHQIEYLWPN